MTGQHEDVYFKYSINAGNIHHADIFRIDTFTLNGQNYKCESDTKFMCGQFDTVIVYACKEDEKKFKPWLLQVIGKDFRGKSSNQTYTNYFFKSDNDENATWKNHEFTQSLNVASGSGSIQKNNSQEKDTLKKTFKALQPSDVSVALGYEYKNSSGSASEIQPKNLPSYLDSEDKKHKNGSNEHEVKSITAGSKLDSFEITIKRRPNTETESTLIYELKSGSTSQIKQKGSSITTDLTKSASTHQANESKEATQSGGSGGGLNSGTGEQGRSQASQESSSNSSSSSGTSEISTAPSEPSYQSKSSSNLTWIVGGTVIGSGGLIGVGVFIYKCIR
ncbi:hypothetical protein BdWA1_001032 [Babesia duncani]|uniref:Uncharacterized protein n=1 Tax=Babesia duncani TaxID=323732 RepID=A0AAD9UQM7_9APIC|nr:hypothetical protein BdWA1_001032 [Babesia duncani]